MSGASSARDRRRPGPPVFLARTSYRQRRLRDALRLLPVLGAVLFAVPLLWPQGAGEGVRMSTALLYIFGVWGLVVVLAAVLTALMRPDPMAEMPQPSSEPEDEG